jgi:CubicO group peptidase (beta-lactamase class C family)
MVTEKLELMLQQAVKSYGLPGLAIGVVKGDQVFYTGAFGKRRMDTPEPVTTRSLFHMASVSKPFVATALVQLAEQGKVDLDAPVVSYLPYFHIDDERSDQLTIRQMLTHTAGMPDVEDLEWEKPQYDAGAVERYVRGLGGEKLIHAPGERFAYSNMAFEVLGDVVSKVAGQAFEEYVKDHIFAPLGMNDSTFLKAQVPPELTMTPHVTTLTTAVSQVYPYNRRHAASSTLHSSAVDMCRWLRGNLNRGELDGKRFLASASYDELLWKPQAPRGGEDATDFVGLSWFLEEHKGHRMIRHGGGDVGFSSNVAMLPDLAVGVAVMVNTIPAAVTQVTASALDLLIGLDPEPIRPSVAVKVGGILQERGLEAAIDRYWSLHETQADGYDYGAEGFLWRAYAARWMKAYEDAITILKLILALYPETDDQVRAYELLGQVYVDEGQSQLAIGSFQQALALNPESSGAAKGLERLLNSAH